MGAVLMGEEAAGIFQASDVLQNVGERAWCALRAQLRVV
jgi:hypothetical protein